jgi:hypothetical protein
MKTTKKPLLLHKQTVRSLSTTQLDRAAGGITGWWCSAAYSCNKTCRCDTLAECTFTDNCPDYSTH